MMRLRNILVAGAVALIAMAVMAGRASAYIVCNGEGDCGHSHRREAVPGQSFEYHSDDWYFHQEWGAYRRFRPYHDGRGYWHNGVWVEL